MAPVDLWQWLIGKWQSDDSQSLRPGVSASDIAAFERKYGVAMPADVRSYFSATDGQQEMGIDLFQFWPLSEVKPVQDDLSAVDKDGRDVHADRFDYPSYFIFADYLISSWEYAVRMEDKPGTPSPVICLDGVHNRQIAASFAEFIEKYVTEPDSIAP